MKTMIFAIAAMFISVVNANAEKVNNTESKVSSTFEVNIANSNHRSMIQTTDNGFTYKYDYILDADGRVVNKITYAWNNDYCDWKPLSAYSVVYTKDETVVSYAKYNRACKSFSKDAQQVRYNANEYPIIIKLPSCCE